MFFKGFPRSSFWNFPYSSPKESFWIFFFLGLCLDLCLRFLLEFLDGYSCSSENGRSEVCGPMKIYSRISAKISSGVAVTVFAWLFWCFIKFLLDFLRGLLVFLNWIPLVIFISFFLGFFLFIFRILSPWVLLKNIIWSPWVLEFFPEVFF